MLERTGGDPDRLEAVRRAQRFRRSWIDLAEHLVKVRRKGSYKGWGYEDFHQYCQSELTLKRGTVDKLTMSYSTLKRHAPQVLAWDGVAKTIPSYEAIGYFSKAVDTDEETPANDVPAKGKKKAPPRVPEMVAELSNAVFDEGAAVGELRKRFDPVFFPKPKGAEELALLKRARSTSLKLAEMLPDISGLPENQVRKLEAELGRLRQRLDALLEAKEKKPITRPREAAAPKRARKAAVKPKAKAKPKPKPKPVGGRSR